MGKTKFNEVLGGLIMKPPGKPTLVPVSDKRPEMNTSSAKMILWRYNTMSKTVKRTNPTKVITGVVRLSYANVWEPKSINGGTENTV